MAVLLDTDHFTILQREIRQGGGALQARLNSLLVEDVLVSIVSFQEQVQGWMAWINRARKPDETIRGFADLQELLRNYSTVAVLPFDKAAFTEFMEFRRQRIRIGTSDLRIAAIAKARGVKLLSRNLRDFRLVPGLDVADWTV